MKLSFRLIAKIGLLLVIIGFFMPIACDLNGFQIAEKMMNNDKGVLGGLLMYLMIASAGAGVIVGVFLLMKKKMNPTIDWVTIVICIAAGLIVYFRNIEGAELQPGAYMIAAGWIVALTSQVISKVNKEK